MYLIGGIVRSIASKVYLSGARFGGLWKFGIRIDVSWKGCKCGSLHCLHWCCCFVLFKFPVATAMSGILWIYNLFVALVLIQWQSMNACAGKLIKWVESIKPPILAGVACFPVKHSSLPKLTKQSWHNDLITRPLLKLHIFSVVKQRKKYKWRNKTGQLILYWCKLEMLRFVFICDRSMKWTFGMRTAMGRHAFKIGWLNFSKGLLTQPRAN